jgi:hypothetical protein
MSKQLKNMIAAEVRKRLEGVNDALLVNVIGLDSANTFNLRRELRSKNISLLVVKNSLAKRATEGTPLARAFDDSEGSLAVVWGGEEPRRANQHRSRTDPLARLEAAVADQCARRQAAQSDQEEVGRRRKTRNLKALGF